MHGRPYGIMTIRVRFGCAGVDAAPPWGACVWGCCPGTRPTQYAAAAAATTLHYVYAAPRSPGSSGTTSHPPLAAVTAAISPLCTADQLTLSPTCTRALISVHCSGVAADVNSHCAHAGPGICALVIELGPDAPWAPPRDPDSTVTFEGCTFKGKFELHVTGKRTRLVMEDCSATGDGALGLNVTNAALLT